jgi:hypothetical protein
MEKPNGEIESIMLGSSPTAKRVTINTGHG